MNKDEEILRLKLALYAMIDQFMYETKDSEGNEYYDDYYESAGEKAFSCLNFEGDRILKKEFYKRYDETRNKLFKLIDENYEDEYIYSEFYKESNNVK